MNFPWRRFGIAIAILITWSSGVAGVGWMARGTAQKRAPTDDPYRECRRERWLEERYAENNRRYFQGQLPEDIAVCWDARLDHGDTVGSYAQVDFDARTIRINPRLESLTDPTQIYLFHEMVHLKTWNDANAMNHGEAFQREMRRLALEGAFDELW